MNIFAFVSTLLLIIAISTHSLIEKGRLGLSVPKSYNGYMNASREVQGQEERKLYDDASKHGETKKITPKKVVSPIQQNKEEKKTNEKNFEKINFNSRINILPLFKNDKAACKDLYEITAELFKILYSSQPFFEKGMEYEILNNMIEKGKELLEKKQPLCLEKIKLSSPYHLCWYKMLKGTKKYKSQKDKGFDSILDYIELIDKKTKKINIPYASINLLTAIFNKEIAHEIMKEQNVNAKYKPITEEKTRQITSKHHFISKRANLWDFLSFTKTQSKSSSLSLSFTDDETKICFKKTLSSAS